MLAAYARDVQLLNFRTVLLPDGLPRPPRRRLATPAKTPASDAGPSLALREFDKPLAAAVQDVDVAAGRGFGTPEQKRDGRAPGSLCVHPDGAFCQRRASLDCCGTRTRRRQLAEMQDASSFGEIAAASILKTAADVI